MGFLYILIFALVLWAVLIFLLLKQNLDLKKEILHLEKEVDIQASRLNYQKAQYFDSENYFYSAMVIIMEMLMEIDFALKSEEGDLSEKILLIIFDKAKALLQPKKCILFRVDLEKGSFSRLYSFGYKDEQLQGLGLSLDANNSFLGWTASTGKFLSFQDAEQDSLLRHLLENDPLESHYSQPLKVDNQLKAVLCVGELQGPTESDVIMRLFSLLSNITTVTLSNALLTQKLRNLSVRDSLTGLYNHSYFQKWLEASLNNLKDKGEVLSLAMVDLDYFKKINDAYGHQTGDIILKNISVLFNSLETENYICARYGGEEFALAFVGKDAKATLAIMQDLRQRISQQVFEIQDGRIQITISVGVATVRFSKAKKIDKTDLIETADQALYKAKDLGKNKVCETTI